MNDINNKQQVSVQKDETKLAPNAKNPAQNDSSSAELEKQILIIYPSRPEEKSDYWTPEYGNVDIPDGWEYLPRGNAYLTRQVKKGLHWILKGRYNRKGGYRPVKGIYAPAEAIEAAKADARATEAKRAQAQLMAQARRGKAEERYRRKFEQACLEFLDFSPVHRELAREIASQTAEWACEKYSGRVGRTCLIDLQEKVALAVRAHIRHRYTDYENQLPSFFDYCKDEMYHQVRAKVQLKVTRFLEEHRAEI